MMSGTEVREGIVCEVTARVATAPQARFYPNGEPLWEFNCRLNLERQTETLTVRAPDRNYGMLQNWAVPGRLLYMRGYLYVKRWKGADKQDKVRLVLEPVELMPLGTMTAPVIQGGAPAAMDYASAQRMPQSTAYPAAEGSTRERRAQLARQLLEEAVEPERST